MAALQNTPGLIRCPWIGQIIPKAQAASSYSVLRNLYTVQYSRSPRWMATYDAWPVACPRARFALRSLPKGGILGTIYFSRARGHLCVGALNDTENPIVLLSASWPALASCRPARILPTCIRTASWHTFPERALYAPRGDVAETSLCPSQDGGSQANGRGRLSCRPLAVDPWRPVGWCQTDLKQPRTPGPPRPNAPTRRRPIA